MSNCVWQPTNKYIYIKIKLSKPFISNPQHKQKYNYFLKKYNNNSSTTTVQTANYSVRY